MANSVARNLIRRLGSMGADQGPGADVGAGMGMGPGDDAQEPGESTSDLVQRISTDLDTLVQQEPAFKEVFDKFNEVLASVEGAEGEPAGAGPGPASAGSQGGA